MVKRTLSDSELFAHSKNRHELNHLQRTLQQIRLDENQTLDTTRIESYKWREFLKENYRNTGHSPLGIRTRVAEASKPSPASGSDVRPASTPHTLQPPWLLVYSSSSYNKLYNDVIDVSSAAHHGVKPLRMSASGVSNSGSRNTPVLAKHVSAAVGVKRVHSAWGHGEKLLKLRDTLGLQRPKTTGHVADNSTDTTTTYSLNCEMKPVAAMPGDEPSTNRNRSPSLAKSVAAMNALRKTKETWKCAICGSEKIPSQTLQYAGLDYKGLDKVKDTLEKLKQLPVDPFLQNESKIGIAGGSTSTEPVPNSVLQPRKNSLPTRAQPGSTRANTNIGSAGHGLKSCAKSCHSQCNKPIGNEQPTAVDLDYKVSKDMLVKNGESKPASHQVNSHKHTNHQQVTSSYKPTTHQVGITSNNKPTTQQLVPVSNKKPTTYQLITASNNNPTTHKQSPSTYTSVYSQETSLGNPTTGQIDQPDKSTMDEQDQPVYANPTFPHQLFTKQERLKIKVEQKQNIPTLNARENNAQNNDQIDSNEGIDDVREETLGPSATIAPSDGIDTPMSDGKADHGDRISSSVNKAIPTSTALALKGNQYIDTEIRIDGSQSYQNSDNVKPGCDSTDPLCQSEIAPSNNLQDMGDQNLGQFNTGTNVDIVPESPKTDSVQEIGLEGKETSEKVFTLDQRKARFKKEVLPGADDNDKMNNADKASPPHKWNRPVGDRINIPRSSVEKLGNEHTREGTLKNLMTSHNTETSVDGNFVSTKDEKWNVYKRNKKPKEAELDGQNQRFYTKIQPTQLNPIHLNVPSHRSKALLPTRAVESKHFTGQNKRAHSVSSSQTQSSATDSSTSAPPSGYSSDTSSSLPASLAPSSVHKSDLAKVNTTNQIKPDLISHKHVIRMCDRDVDDLLLGDGAAIEYKGVVLRNYIRPQLRYKTAAKEKLKRSPSIHLHAVGGAIVTVYEQPDKARLLDIVFPKQARQKALAKMVEENHRRSLTAGGGLTDAVIRRRIENFLKSVEPYCRNDS